MAPTLNTPTLAPGEIPLLQEEVRALARERDAVILAHNYQLPEVQDVADYVGDSLGLSRQGAKTKASVIAFCGVHFMAETASILSPDKQVLIPDLGAGCSLADSITPDELRAWQARHPGAVTVMYVNTTAEIKAMTDYCVTSSNAVAVVEHIYREHGEDTEILFGPDMFLGAYVEKTTGRPMSTSPPGTSMPKACTCSRPAGCSTTRRTPCRAPPPSWRRRPGCSTRCAWRPPTSTSSRPTSPPRAGT
jgi:quinolinate synthase